MVIIKTLSYHGIVLWLSKVKHYSVDLLLVCQKTHLYLCAYHGSYYCSLSYRSKGVK